MSEFDRIISRTDTASVKHDGREAYFGAADVIPLWIADMDFAVPEVVAQALAERAAHPVFGYTLHPDGMFEALIHWLRKRHGWEIERDWIVLCPGVVPALHAVVMALTDKGDGVIVQPPVYFPFFSAVTTSDRSLLLNPLRLEGGRYVMDYEGLERQAAEGAKLLLLCSPHNPVGRVWARQELSELLRIADRHDLTILSDEIHADLVYPGFRNLSLAALAENAPNIVTAVAPSKSFNIPGLGLSALIVPCPKRRRKINQAFELLHVTAANPFGIVAFEAAYRGGEAWLDRLLAYLAETRNFVRGFIHQRLPRIRLVEPEGTYLLWLDCRGLGANDEELKQFFVQEAGVGMSPGAAFGKGGEGFVRMNIGAPRAVIEQALGQIERAYCRRGFDSGR